MTELPPTHPAADLFPLLGETELAELADDIHARGLTHPVWFYDDPTEGHLLLDGRNRWLACHLVGIDPEVRWFHGDELEAAEFAVSENVRRRHLTTGQKAAVAYESLPIFEAAMAKRKARMMAEAASKRERDERGRLKPSEESEPHQMRADLPASGDGESGPPDPEYSDVVTPPELVPVGNTEPARPRARDQAAKKAGTSGRATAQYKRIVEQAPDLAAKVKNKEMALDRAERIIRDREAERRRIEQARREAAAEPAPSRVDIRHGDFREVLADVSNVDAVITDPPYPAEFLPLLADLAAWADKVLTPDGVLAVLIGQTHLPEVYRLLDGHRSYRWTGCYLTEGPGYVSHARKVQSSWKPLLVYGRGPRFGDIIRSEGSNADAKSNHKWGQDYAAFHTIIERLTQRGQTVADPFMGAGTTLLAAHALGRHAIGCDIDATAVQRSRERVGDG
jgi:ParB-like chromosome segregation protein Spo0J